MSTKATPVTDVESILLTQWEQAGQKIADLTQSIPDSLYEFKPAESVRTVSETIRHVAFWNGYLAKILLGEIADGTANELPKDDYPDKASVLKALEASTAEVGPAFRKHRAENAAELLVAFTVHTGEHYGQLAVYARLNGIVPPASR